MSDLQYSFSFFHKYTIIQKCIDTDDVILKNKQNGQFALMKQVSVENIVYEQLVINLQNRKRLKHENLLTLLNYNFTKNTIITIQQFCVETLYDQFLNRIHQRQKFTEEELWNILTSLVFGLSFLQENGIHHGRLSLNNIFISEEGNVKIADSFQTLFQHCFVLQKQKDSINFFKSDVFILGYFMLQITLMKQIQELFSDKNGFLDQNKLKQYLRQLQNLQISRDYIDLLKNMLLIDESQRPSFIQLKETVLFLFLGQKKQDKQNQSLIKSKLTIRQSQQTKQNSINNHNHQKQNICKPPIFSFHNQFSRSSQNFNDSTESTCKRDIDKLFGSLTQSIKINEQDLSISHFNIENKENVLSSKQQTNNYKLKHFGNDTQKLQFQQQKKRKRVKNSQKQQNIQLLITQSPKKQIKFHKNSASNLNSSKAISFHNPTPKQKIKK